VTENTDFVLIINRNQELKLTGQAINKLPAESGLSPINSYWELTNDM